MAKTKSILIIDDSNTNVVLLQAILSTKGYKTQTALSVKEAMPLIKRKKPELILLDLLMPEVSGYDFLEQVQKDPSLQSIPIVIVSALTDDLNIEKTKKMGALEFIEKPIDIPSLVNIVERFLD